MSIRKLIVQYVGDVLRLPKLERDVMRIYERDRIGRTVREYVPIVRCKDCLNYVEGLITDDNEREPSYCCHWKREYIREDGFCSYAERMK